MAGRVTSPTRSGAILSATVSMPYSLATATRAFAVSPSRETPALSVTSRVVVRRP